MRILRIALFLVVVAIATTLSSVWWRNSDDALQGYVEGDFLDVAAEETARLVALDVRRGDKVEAGAVLFRLDDSDATAARKEAEARLAQAKAQLADLQTGKRQEEIDVLQAQRDEVVASLKNARSDFQRYQALHEASVVSDARTEQAQQQFEVLEARLKAMESQIEVARLAARDDQIRAAEDAVDAAKAAIERIDARIARLSGTALLSGSVQDTYFDPGEVVPAGRPVVSVLPPQNLKVRFFVPEDQYSRIALNDTIEIGCDGCDEPIEAQVTFISQSAEFTPPVIYSIQARQKLVYMIEATPPEPGVLKVGQPVDVRLNP